MATLEREAAAFHGPAAVIGSASSATGAVEVSGAPTGLVAIGFEDQTVIAGTESGTTDGLYKFARSTTTAATLVYLIL